MDILFVCASNVCRSPYCEYMFRRMVENDPELKGKNRVRSSAVLNQMKEIDEKTRKSLRREGFSDQEIDLHRPGVWYRDRDKFKDADIIIGMTRFQKFLCPFPYRKKFTTLSEAATGKYHSIPDPWLIEDMDRYYAEMDKIKGYLLQYFEKLKQKMG